MFDLHVHSTASDGLADTGGNTEKKPGNRAQRNCFNRSRYCGAELKAAKKYWTEHKLSLDFIPGIEMNTEVDETGFIYWDTILITKIPSYWNKLEEIKEARLERARKMVYRLKSMGLAVTLRAS